MDIWILTVMSRNVNLDGLRDNFELLVELEEKSEDDPVFVGIFKVPLHILLIVALFGCVLMFIN